MLEVEVVITSQDNSKIKGYSHLKYSGGGYEKYTITGNYNEKRSTLSFYEDKKIGISGIRPSECVSGSYTMTLSINKDVMRLAGIWEPNRNELNPVYGMKRSVVWLEKPIAHKEESAEKVIEAAPESIVDKNLQRDIRIEEVIEISKAEIGNIKLEFIDNERIDNDIISVYINDEQKINKQTISATPISITLTIPETERNTIVMIAAESYGSVAPCTVLMKITTPSKQYEIDLSSTFSSNAAIKFVIKD